MDDRLFRPFDHPQIYEWTIEQVEEIASRLVEHAPKHGANPWPWAAHHAIRYLDARRAACLEAMASSKAQAEIIQRIDEEAPAIAVARATRVDFDKGVRMIVGGKAKTMNALPMYKKYLKHCPKMFEYYFGVALCAEDSELVRVREDVDVFSRAPLLGEELTREQASAVRLVEGWEELMFTQPLRPGCTEEETEYSETPQEMERVAKIWDCYIDSYIEDHRKVGLTMWDIETQGREFQERKAEIASTTNRENARKRWKDGDAKKLAKKVL